MKAYQSNQKAKHQDSNMKNSQRMIFVHGLHPLTTREELTEIFSEYCEISNFSMTQASRAGINKGYAFFAVPNAKVAEMLVQSEHILHGRKIHCDLKHRSRTDEEKSQRKRVFFGGVKKGTTDKDITAFFAQFGRVRTAYAIVDIRGNRKNYGYVDFFNEKSAKVAVENSPVMIEGKKVDVRPFYKKDHRSKRKAKSSRYKKFKKGVRRTPSPSDGASFDSHASTQPTMQTLNLEEETPRQEPVSPTTSIAAPLSQDKPGLKKEDLERGCYDMALPLLSSNVLGCFMNKKGEQLQQLMKLYMNATITNDQMNANLYYSQVQFLKHQIFSEAERSPLLAFGF